mgnify:CR=1 FL=1|tara:strand:- start:167 stop:355 length:189 start_codon:yes stop_codon:yes gene_type:complete
MIKNINILVIIGLSLFYSPLHSKEISQNQESLSSSFKEIAEEMKNLNSNLELLSNTISNLLP